MTAAEVVEENSPVIEFTDREARRAIIVSGASGYPTARAGLPNGF